MPGVDNFCYDVHLSPVFCETTAKIVFHFVVKHAKAAEELDEKFDWLKDRNEFKRLSRDLMLDAVKKAKLGDGEIQVDHLAQIAVCKFLILQIRKQFEVLETRFNNLVWEFESADDDDVIAETVSLKERLLNIRHHRNTIITGVSKEIFQYFLDAQRSLKERREANYGRESLLSEDLFTNPILHIENQNDDYFMLEQYVLLGHRIDDPDRYDTVLKLVRDLLSKIRMPEPSPPEPNGREKETGAAAEAGKTKKKETGKHDVDGWIKQVDTVSLLFDYFNSTELIQDLNNRKKQNKEQLRTMELRLKEQKKLFNYFYNKFNQKRLLARIVASFEMKTIYLEYCPPLVPQQVLQFLVSSSARTSITNYVKRLKTYYDKTVSLAPLKKMVVKIGRLQSLKRKKYFLQFLDGFFRFHRDMENFKLLKLTFDRVSLVDDEKTIALSKTNNTLYEYLLPQEQMFDLETKPVTSHVILKADVRGATAITRQLRESGLNPASYFSLNFFNPISEIVFQYGAMKVFIEGDAIILAILERKEEETGKYCVSRACGLAINMLNIIQRYNVKSRKYKLPILELGFGICYQNQPPAYLLDGKKKIMISPAINTADRLSGCHKKLRRTFDRKSNPFNLYVYLAGGENSESLSDDEIVRRYNVNGIELNEAGFAKLAKEIDLKTMDCRIPELDNEDIRIHTGKFPLVTGTYQRLVIREDVVREVNAADFQVRNKTTRKYYEVCSNPILTKYVKGKE
jgi:class 3 adenylate cyclase